MIDLLITFLVFVLVVVLVFYVVRWLMGLASLPPEIQKVVLIVLGVLALIVFLSRFVKPLIN